METRYIRNRIYLNAEEQKLIKDIPILLAGCGIGSVIAESALRLGFENITLVDGDTVEMSNLNRQNFTEKDIGVSKVEALKERLHQINSKANITVREYFITKDNVGGLLEGKKIAINALDFTTDLPLSFDKICQQKGITVLHPYNLGWAGVLAIVTPTSLRLDNIQRLGKRFNEVEFVKYVLGYNDFRGSPQYWIRDILNSYLKETEEISPPQLSVGASLVGSMCTLALFNIATGREIKQFPEFYFTSLIT